MGPLDSVLLRCAQNVDAANQPQQLRRPLSHQQKVALVTLPHLMVDGEGVRHMLAATKVSASLIVMPLDSVLLRCAQNVDAAKQFEPANSVHHHQNIPENKWHDNSMLYNPRYWSHN